MTLLALGAKCGSFSMIWLAISLPDDGVLQPPIIDPRAMAPIPEAHCLRKCLLLSMCKSFSRASLIMLILLLCYKFIQVHHGVGHDGHTEQFLIFLCLVSGFSVQCR